ncbi:MAG: hypothetical protein E3J72_16940 [Planctomycetota bacterium]|nr:MAG: hypothetical protein E3J72_16940 [Planctomycetota bacterium]
MDEKDLPTEIMEMMFSEDLVEGEAPTNVDLKQIESAILLLARRLDPLLKALGPDPYIGEQTLPDRLTALELEMAQVQHKLQGGE